MFNKTNISRFLLLLIAFSLVITIIGSRGCPKRDRSRVGSSDGVFRINAPSNLTATAISYSEIRLLWQDNSNNEDGFEIERRIIPTTGYSLLVIVGPNIISYSDTAVTPLNTYSYRVRAYMGSDYSGYSNEAQAMTRFFWNIIATGCFHSFALSSNGRLWSWGQNDYGQLGLGDWNNRNIPNLIEFDDAWNLFGNIVAVVGNKGWFGYTLARKADGTIWGWGANSVGQLGIDDTNTPNAPVQIGSDSNWATLDVGESHSLVLKINGTLWVWGGNSEGQLGLGDAITRTTPTQVTTETDWLVVSDSNRSTLTAGGQNSFVLKTTGNLWAWGRNRFGQLGLGDTISRATPTRVTNETDWSTIFAGFWHTCAIKTTGALWVWGCNDYGELGLGDDGRGTDRMTPTQLVPNTDWINVAVGSTYTMALKTASTLWSWGRNNYGQLGLGDTINRNTPTQIGIASDWSQIAAGDYHTLGRKTNGTLWAWGQNQSGQLGLGDSGLGTNRNIPTLVGE